MYQVMRRGQCVDVRPPACDPPAKLNRRGACECPQGMVQKGRECVASGRPDVRDPRSGGPRGGSQGPAESLGRR